MLGRTRLSPSAQPDQRGTGRTSSAISRPAHFATFISPRQVLLFASAIPWASIPVLPQKAVNLELVLNVADHGGHVFEDSQGKGLLVFVPTRFRC